MKFGYLLVCVLPLMVLGCKHQPAPAPPQEAARATAISNGGYTWFVGETKLNGTNAGPVTVTPRVTTSPTTNGVTQ